VLTAGPLSAGPFELSFPVLGLDRSRLPAVTNTLREALPGNVHRVVLAPDRWILEPSTVGLEVRVRTPIGLDAIMKGLSAHGLERRGAVLTPKGAILVVSIEKPMPYRKLSEILKPHASQESRSSNSGGDAGTRPQDSSSKSRGRSRAPWRMRTTSRSSPSGR